MNRAAIFLLFMLMTATLLKAQPVATDTSIQVSQVMQVRTNVVRMVMNNIDHALYYGTFSGNIYKVLKSGTTYYDTLIATSAAHNINYLQGMAFRDSMLYLSGNRKSPGASGYGLVIRGRLKPSGTWQWDTLLRTVAYQSTATLFDHAFSSICFSPAGDSIYIGSGARTDHGEVQTSNGLFPNTREVPLTSLILCIPANPAQPIVLSNDSATLAASPYIYCRGVRNTFDMAFAANGDLFGSENSGDRDDADELNWLKKGGHYGFPWRMGGNATPMQFQNYIPGNDLLINHHSLSWTGNNFYNDPTYPLPPQGVTFTEPIKNYGPDADEFRDTLTGSSRDASNEGTYITSFTPHRSPLGLVFDTEGKLAPPYNSAGFMLSYTEGTADSTGTLANGGTGPFSDTGQDLLQLALFKDSTSGQYSMNCYRLANGFKNPVDALLDENILYVIESHGASNPVPPRLYALTFPLNSKKGSSSFLPKDTTICSGSFITITPNLKGQFGYLWSNGATTAQITVAPSVNTGYTLKIYNGITVSIDTILVTVTTAPLLPGAITGLAKPCPGSNNVDYSVAPKIGVTSYYWYFVNGSALTLASGQGTNSIKVNYAANFTSSTILVAAGNQCGLSGGRSKSVIRNIPGTPSTISGPVSGLCGGVTTNYSISPVSVASTYLWTVPTGANINSGQGTTAINVTFPSVFSAGTITVKAGNVCGYGAQRTLSVKGAPSVPVSISGPLAACANQQGVNYQTPLVAGATTYNWTVPSGASITSGQGSDSIVVGFGTASGTVRVRAANSCGTSTYKSISVIINCTAEEDAIDLLYATIYSNPGNDYFTFTNISNQERCSLQIFSITGMLIEEWDKIDIGKPFNFGQHFTRGIYFAEILQGNHKKVIKLIR